MKKQGQVLRFFRFLLVPALFGLVLACIWLCLLSPIVILISFFANFLGFLCIFMWRVYRHGREFKATVTVSIGLYLELAAMYFLSVGGHIRMVEPWVLALYLVMLFILATGLFAYAVALKALVVYKEEEEKYKKSTKEW